MAFILVFAFVFTRGLQDIPRRGNNLAEFMFESLSNFAHSIGGEQARRYVPLFAALFLFILFSNWSGLLPLVGKVEALRAPTSDLNVTIGLALVSFFTFHVEGVRSLGPGGYLGEVLPARRVPRRESEPGYSVCSSGCSSSCWSSSSPSHWQCDSLATSTAARSRLAS